MVQFGILPTISTLKKYKNSCSTSRDFLMASSFFMEIWKNMIKNSNLINV